MFAPLVLTSSMEAQPMPYCKVPMGTPAGMTGVGMYDRQNNAAALAAFALRRPLGLGCACGCNSCGKGIEGISMPDVAQWIITGGAVALAGWVLKKELSRRKRYRRARGRA